ncbi:hypothetical protein C7M84_024233 [Penaeus vannamei]|uniref:Uncharacterized protein n=1 Tax=Penaeus vannamei TaxID=6689 RepID=A0A423U1Q0_PENVA|nr:hypothetical protein C7M84_024233 [Penaeus vannamei]
MPHLTFFLSYLPSLPHFPPIPIVPPPHPRISHLSSYPSPILQPLFLLIPLFFRKGLERGQEFAAAFPTLCERAPPPPPVVRRPVETADWSSHTLPTGQSSRGFHFRPWDNVDPRWVRGTHTMAALAYIGCGGDSLLLLPFSLLTHVPVFPFCVPSVLPFLLLFLLPSLSSSHAISLSSPLPSFAIILIPHFFFLLIFPYLLFPVFSLVRSSSPPFLLSFPPPFLLPFLSRSFVSFTPISFFFPFSPFFLFLFSLPSPLSFSLFYPPSLFLFSLPFRLILSCLPVSLPSFSSSFLSLFPFSPSLSTLSLSFRSFPLLSFFFFSSALPSLLSFIHLLLSSSFSPSMSLPSRSLYFLPSLLFPVYPPFLFFPLLFISFLPFSLHLSFLFFLASSPPPPSLHFLSLLLSTSIYLSSLSPSSCPSLNLPTSVCAPSGALRLRHEITTRLPLSRPYRSDGRVAWRLLTTGALTPYQSSGTPTITGAPTTTLDTRSSVQSPEGVTRVQLMSCESSWRDGGPSTIVWVTMPFC